MGLEPYARVVFEGRTLNRRTAAYLAQAETIYHLLGGRGDFRLAQGSYNPGAVAASGGTHDGGGAFDITVLSGQEHTAEWATRLCGGASWFRPELWRNNTRVWGKHIHGIVIGDKEMSAGAARQVIDYYAGRDGLVSHARDVEPRPTVIPVFRYPLHDVNLANVRSQARTPTHALHGVRVVQRALNLKVGSDLKVDGLYGSVTRATYAQYEKAIYSSNRDGIPSLFDLTLLGAARFTVIKE